MEFEAADYIDMKHSMNIILVCRGVRKTAGGFIWKFKNKDI